MGLIGGLGGGMDRRSGEDWATWAGDGVDWDGVDWDGDDVGWEMREMRA